MIFSMMSMLSEISSINTSDVHPAQADCTILVVAPDNLLEVGQYKELSDARQLIVLINKMYTMSLRKIFSTN
jgi:hypothetical protein